MYFFIILNGPIIRNIYETYVCHLPGALLTGYTV
jgi:hypothetical protein